MKKEKNRGKKFTFKFAKVCGSDGGIYITHTYNFKGFINSCIVILECLAHYACYLLNRGVKTVLGRGMSKMFYLFITFCEEFHKHASGIQIITIQVNTI